MPVFPAPWESTNKKVMVQAVITPGKSSSTELLLQLRFGIIVKAGSTGFAERLGMVCQRRVKNDFKFFCLQNKFHIN
jgi:hypothetical protein